MTPRLPADSRGFTLIEVVVALSMLSILMVGLIGALVTFGNTGSRLEQRALESDDVRLVHAFLRQSLAAASAQQQVREEDQALTVGFVGGEQQLEWVGLMPARHGAGGLYKLRLRLAPGVDDEEMLMLDYRPYLGQEDTGDWSTGRSHELIDGQLLLAFSYMRAGTDAWQSYWDDPAVLPELVRMELERNGERWPDFAVRVLAAEPGVDLDRSADEGRR
tara:strand:+ start:462 stop:1118 length:657 start_codon:yes stop_codon:yes gene_type:complete